MPISFISAKELLSDTIEKIENKPEEHWALFLKCSSFQYKYPLHQQLMITHKDLTARLGQLLTRGNE